MPRGGHAAKNRLPPRLPRIEQGRRLASHDLVLDYSSYPDRGKRGPNDAPVGENILVVFACWRISDRLTVQPMDRPICSNHASSHFRLALMPRLILPSDQGPLFK